MHAFVPAHPVRRVAAALAALAAGLVLALAAPPVAGAQVTDEGHVTIEASHPAGGTDVHFIVRVTDKRDEPGNEAIVTATPLLAGGGQLTPVRLSPADTDGRYEGIISFPNAGQYTLRITTVGPDARIEQPVTVTVSASTTPTTAKPGQTTASAPSTSFAPADDGTGSSAASAGEDDGGVPTGAFLLLAIVIIAGVTAAIVVLRRTGPGAGGDAEPAEEAAAQAEGEAAEPAGDTEPAGDAQPAGDTQPAGDAQPAGDTQPAGETEPAGPSVPGEAAAPAEQP